MLRASPNTPEDQTPWRLQQELRILGAEGLVTPWLEGDGLDILKFTTFEEYLEMMENAIRASHCVVGP
jgi:hypothetical protein